MFTLSQFEIGSARPLLARHERVNLGLRSPARLFYASDLHLGWPWSNRLIEELPAVARSVAPMVVILGGDLVDRRSALSRLTECVAALAKVAPVYAIAGNHDHLLGSDKVRAAVENGDGAWLADPVGIGVDVVLCSGVDAAAPPSGHRILCAHDPAIFPQACLAGVGLVLAGRLHGGQCVLAARRGRLYPGAWFARWTGLRFEQNTSTMLVSRGAADALPLRWNCPREVIVCDAV